MLSTGNQMINIPAAGHTRPVPIAVSNQVYVVAPPQPHSFATGEPLEVVEELPVDRATENWVLSTSDVYTHVDVGTLRGHPGDSGTLRGIQTGLVHESPGSDVVLLYAPPPPEVSPTVVLQGPQDIDMAISNFHIKFDKRDSFKPGDEISGKVL